MCHFTCRKQWWMVLTCSEACCWWGRVSLVYWGDQHLVEACQENYFSKTKSWHLNTETVLWEDEWSHQTWRYCPDTSQQSWKKTSNLWGRLMYEEFWLQSLFWTVHLFALVARFWWSEWVYLWILWVWWPGTRDQDEWSWWRMDPCPWLEDDDAWLTWCCIPRSHTDHNIRTFHTTSATDPRHHPESSSTSIHSSAARASCSCPIRDQY